jgi:hypothetical protein
MSNKKFLGRVYCIRSPSTDEIYIGSTINGLSRRMAIHRSLFNCFIGSGDFKYWCNSFYILNHLDAYIELISEHENISKDELRKLEGEAIRANKNICINKNIAGEVWDKEKFKDYAKDYNPKYYQQNRDKILLQVKANQKKKKEELKSQ